MQRCLRLWMLRAWAPPPVLAFKLPRPEWLDPINANPDTATPTHQTAPMSSFSLKREVIGCLSGNVLSYIDRAEKILINYIINRMPVPWAHNGKVWQLLCRMSAPSRGFCSVLVAVRAVTSCFVHEQTQHNPAPGRFPAYNRRELVSKVFKSLGTMYRPNKINHYRPTMILINRRVQRPVAARDMPARPPRGLADFEVSVLHLPNFWAYSFGARRCLCHAEGL